MNTRDFKKSVSCDIPIIKEIQKLNKSLLQPQKPMLLRVEVHKPSSNRSHMRNDYSLRFTVKASYSNIQLHLAGFELVQPNPKVGITARSEPLSHGAGPAVPISENVCSILGDIPCWLAFQSKQADGGTNTSSLNK